MQTFPRMAAPRGRIRFSIVELAVAVSTLGVLPFTSAAANDLAKDIDRSDPSTRLPTIVVTATRIPTPINQLGSSITVITAEDIRRHQWRTLPDALQSVPGLNVVQTGGTGGRTSVFMRGANSNHTKVLIDGVDANDPSQNGAFDFGQIVTSDVERIEVLRGPQSGLYGSDALGGVINVITRKGVGPTRVTGSLEGGSFGTFNQTAGVRGSSARFNYAFNVAHLFSDETAVTPLELLPPGRRRIDDKYENTTVSTRLGVDLTDTFGVNLAARYTDSTLLFTAGDFSAFPSVPAAAQSEQNAHQLFTRGEAHFSLFDGKFRNRFGIGYTDDWTRIQAPDTEFGTPPPSFNRGDRVKVDWQGTLALAPGQTVVLGLEDQSDRLIDSPISAQNSNEAAFVELQSHVIEALFVAASIRYDDHERFGGKSTWRIAPSYVIAATGTRLKASYGTGFKAPSLTQLFVSFPDFNFFANPDLRPEESAGFDFGFEQSLRDDRARFGATWFRNDIENLIDTNATGTSLENVGQASTYGVESFASVAVTDRFEVRADYSYTVAKNDMTDEELLRRPKHKASLGATWLPTDRLSLSATTIYVGSWVDGNRSFTIPRLNASPYFLVNVAASYDLGNGLTLFGRIDNLLDRRYEDPVGFQRRGLGAFAGIRVNFGAGRSESASRKSASRWQSVSTD